MPHQIYEFHQLTECMNYTEVQCFYLKTAIAAGRPTCSRPRALNTAYFSDVAGIKQIPDALTAATLDAVG